MSGGSSPWSASKPTTAVECTQTHKVTPWQLTYSESKRCCRLLFLFLLSLTKSKQCRLQKGRWVPDEDDEDDFKNDKDFDDEVTEAEADQMLKERGNLKS